MADDSFEMLLGNRLKKDLPHRAKALAAAYSSTLEYLKNNIYEEIRGAEPQLTDHGSRHIANVQRNILALLGDGEATDGETATKEVSGVELYLLAMATLFHDVGNIHGRRDHQRNIGAIFDDARGTSAATRREKTLVLRACAAHTGLASDGTRDTLKEVAPTEQLEGKKIQLQQLAAILRFADELAEGPQRTSEFRRQNNDYDSQSQIYQEYAAVTDVFIDRGNHRISLAYEIPVDTDDEDPKQRQGTLQALLQYILHRIVKLDQERRYAVHYAPVLSAFNKTVASFTFHCGKDLLALDLPRIELNDLTIPGADAKPLEETYTAYSPTELAPMLMVRCKEAKEAR